MSYRITVILAPQPEGGYTVTCQELPELITQGDSVEEALENVKDAFATTLELYERLERPLPKSIEIPEQNIPAPSEPFQFETLTPVKSADNTPSFWFQGIAPSRSLHA